LRWSGNFQLLTSQLDCQNIDVSEDIFFEDLDVGQSLLVGPWAISDVWIFLRSLGHRFSLHRHAQVPRLLSIPHSCLACTCFFQLLPGTSRHFVFSKWNVPTS
jgi:hypothetical protein